MRRSICICHPNIVLAGSIGNWSFSYSPSTDLPKGTKLKFDLLSKGRPIDWEVPSPSPKKKKNTIWGKSSTGKIFYPEEILKERSYTPYFEFTLPYAIKADDTFTIYLGTQSKKKEEAEKNGNRAQTVVGRRKPFHLYVDPKGKGDYRDPEVFTIDIRGNVLSNIRIIAPSLVSKNKRFDVIVRFEDAFGNLTNNAPEDTLIELSYEHLRENLNWKLFVPETGFLSLPNLYFNEAGIYKIQLFNPKMEKIFYSSPIFCTEDAVKGIYWGLLHGESERFDSYDNVESCLRHFRDEKALQFFASSPFESNEETSSDDWKKIQHQITEFNEDERFTTLLGFQWFEEDKTAGLRQFIYFKDNKSLLRKKDLKSNALKKIYKSHTPKEFISIPSFTMAKGMEYTFEDFNPEFEHVVEIYNAWGCSECTKKEGNLFPIESDSKKGIFENPAGSIRSALNQNNRFGFVAGGLDDRGLFVDFYESEQVQYSPGLTAIIALEQTRDALMLALQNRSCYATTGERIILGFFIAGAQMGAELNTTNKPGLAFNRHITGYIAGTAPLKEVTIFRCGKPIHTFSSKESYHEFAIDDSEHSSQVALKSPDERPDFIYYYMRVLQADDHVAWTSPIWIDIIEGEEPIIATLPSKKKKKK